MNTITARRNTARRSRGLRARRIGSLSIAGAAACLVLTPGLAQASQIPLDIPPDTAVPATARANDNEDVVTVRKTQLAADWAKRLAPATTVARAQLSGSDFVIVEKSTHRTVPAKGPTCFIPESLDSWSRRLIAVQIDFQDKATPIQDFGGHTTTPAALADEWKVRVTPTVFFFGPDGRELAGRLDGVSSTDFYGSYLEERLETARRALKK